MTILEGAGENVGTAVMIPENNGADVRRIDGKATGKDDGDAVRETVGESNDPVPATVLMTPLPGHKDISHILDTTDITQT